MTNASIEGGPISIRFDEQGEVDPEAEQRLVDYLTENRPQDVVLFSHGWNNDERAATALYGRWFDLLNEQLGDGRKVAFVGIRWPSQLWRDEPIPDFDPTPSGNSGGAAGLRTTPSAQANGAALSDQEVADLKELFPQGASRLDAIADLLAAEPDGDGIDDLFTALRGFNAAVKTGFDDGETDESGEPGMLGSDQKPREVFQAFADALQESGVDLSGDGGGAGLRDDLAKVWQGAKEALRQLSYWKMKNRAGIVGQEGVGPLISRIAANDEIPGIRFHLVGHSFGARVVSYALAGGSTTTPSPIKSVTLLEAAFSRFAFSDPLPFDPATDSAPAGKGALAGNLARVDGPFTVCWSSHDSALGVMYPLASMAAHDDRAGINDPLFRWRAMGSLGAYEEPGVNVDEVGTKYPFADGKILNVDASAVVQSGGPPAGAHSDIFHPELAWIVASAAKLT